MLPDHLREPLTQVGARVTPQADGSTHVHVPGSFHEFLFGPDGIIESRSVGHDSWSGVGSAITNLFTTPHHQPNVDRAIDLMARGMRTHTGPHHELRVEQYPVRSLDTPPVYRIRIRHTLHTDPNTPHADAFVTETDTSKALATAALHHNAPIEALVDYLTELHDLSDKVISYSREMDFVLGVRK